MRRNVVRICTPVAHPACICQPTRHASTATPRSRKKKIKLSDLTNVIYDAEGAAAKPLEPLVLPSKPNGRKKPAASPPDAPPDAARQSPNVVRRFVQSERPSIDSVKSVFARDVLQNLDKFPNAILLTRVGQFWESYFEQAIELAKLLNIKLTSKLFETSSNKARYPMAGFPLAHLDRHLATLVQDNGKFVALCEEFKTFPNTGRAAVELAKKGEVGTAFHIERRVVRVVTPGTLIDESFIDNSESHYLLAISLPSPSETSPQVVELAWVDVSTGDFYSESTLSTTLADDIAQISPKEIVLPPHIDEDHWIWSHLDKRSYSIAYVSPQPPEEVPESQETVGPPVAITSSAVALLSLYVSQTLLEAQPLHGHPLQRRTSHRLQIDAKTLDALEIRKNASQGGVARTLLATVSRTITPAGKRLLIDRLSAPSTQIKQIQSRHALVAFFVERPHLRDSLREVLRGMDDAARTLQRMSLRRADVGDLLAICRTLKGFSTISEDLAQALSEPATLSTASELELQTISTIQRELTLHQELANLIDSTVDREGYESRLARDQDPLFYGSGEDESPNNPVDEAELEVEEGRLVHVRAGKLSDRISWGKADIWVIKQQFSEEMESWHRQLVDSEAAALKIADNFAAEHDLPPQNVTLRLAPKFGAVLRVKKKAGIKVVKEQDDLMLVQKSASIRSYALTKWTRLNAKIQTILVQIRELEKQAIQTLCEAILEQWTAIRANAAIVAELDVAMGFADLAVEAGYEQPCMTQENVLEIKEGRHPSVEAMLRAQNRAFTPNDTRIGDQSLVQVITGPNMGGKSTYLRQIALMVILAQAGSFIPATSATISITDKLFARVRTGDNLTAGQSSFRVEIENAAAVLNNATPNSLVLMDELGRGTTQDYGISVAYSTIASILRNNRCKTLFATHLHDVIDLLREPPGEVAEEGLEGVEYFCTDVETMEDGGIFYSHKLKKGVNRDAHALKAAQVSGYPSEALTEAEKVYKWLSSQRSHKNQ